MASRPATRCQNSDGLHGARVWIGLDMLPRVMAETTAILNRTNSADLHRRILLCVLPSV